MESGAWKIMGKAKTQRTERLIQAGRRRVIVEEVSNRIEQHNFERLVKQGVIMEDKEKIEQANWSPVEDKDAWWPIKDRIILKMFGIGRGLKKTKTPKRQGWCKSLSPLRFL